MVRCVSRLRWRFVFSNYVTKALSGKDVDKAVTFLISLFLAEAPPEIEDNIETHVTCALDRDMMGKVFDVVVEHILLTRMQHMAM